MLQAELFRSAVQVQLCRKLLAVHVRAHAVHLQPGGVLGLGRLQCHIGGGLELLQLRLRADLEHVGGHASACAVHVCLGADQFGFAVNQGPEPLADILRAHHQRLDILHGGADSLRADLCGLADSKAGVLHMHVRHLDGNVARLGAQGIGQPGANGVEAMHQRPGRQGVTTRCPRGQRLVLCPGGLTGQPGAVALPHGRLHDDGDSGAVGFQRALQPVRGLVEVATRREILVHELREGVFQLLQHFHAVIVVEVAQPLHGESVGFVKDGRRAIVTQAVDVPERWHLRRDDRRGSAGCRRRGQRRWRAR